MSSVQILCICDCKRVTLHFVWITVCMEGCRYSGGRRADRYDFISQRYRREILQAYRMNIYEWILRWRFIVQKDANYIFVLELSCTELFYVDIL